MLDDSMNSDRETGAVTLHTGSRTCLYMGESQGEAITSIYNVSNNFMSRRD